MESGEIILGGRGHRLSPQFIQQVLQLSDQLDLNEFSSAELLRAAMQQVRHLRSHLVSHFTLQQSRYLDLEAQEIALVIYFSERSFLLLTILRLLKV